MITNATFERCAFHTILPTGTPDCIACKKAYCLMNRACPFFQTFEERARRLKKYGDGSLYILRKQNEEKEKENS